jgi:hypothetical protein
MDNDKIAFFCPQCNYEKNVVIPGKFKCSRCGCKFKIDSNQRMTSIENMDGETVEVHQPNKIPWQTRIYYLIASPILLLYGTFGLIHDDIYIPGKRSRGIHFHGYAAVIVFIVFLFAISNMLSVIIDHFDKRDNEINYRYFAKITSRIALALFVIAVVVQIMINLE